MTNKINLTSEKIDVSTPIIRMLENDILNPEKLTGDMLRGIIEKCHSLIESDF